MDTDPLEGIANVHVDVLAARGLCQGTPDPADMTPAELRRYDEARADRNEEIVEKLGLTFDEAISAPMFTRGERVFLLGLVTNAMLVRPLHPSRAAMLQRVEKKLRGGMDW